MNCGPEPTTWTAQFSSGTTIIFDRGRAMLTVDVSAYDNWGGSASTRLSNEIRLTRAAEA